MPPEAQWAEVAGVEGKPRPAGRCAPSWPWHLPTHTSADAIVWLTRGKVQSQSRTLTPSPKPQSGGHLA